MKTLGNRDCLSLVDFRVAGVFADAGRAGQAPGIGAGLKHILLGPAACGGRLVIDSSPLTPPIFWIVRQYPLSKEAGLGRVVGYLLGAVSLCR